MATLLIIGGSGFFGKSFLDGYKRGILEKWDITQIKILARRASDLENTNPELMDKTIKLNNLDISNCNILPNAEYVIHAAASTDASKYLESSSVEKENIQKSTINYSKLAPLFHKRSKILYVSSGAVYGRQPENLKFISEDVHFGPVDLMDQSKQDYAAAKRDAEQVIRKLGETGCQVSIARCFAFTGKYLPRDQHFAIGNFIQNALDGLPIEVKAKGLVYRSYMYSDDLIEWLMSILIDANPSCPVFNVGSNKAIEVEELAKIIVKKENGIVKVSKCRNIAIDRYIPCVKKIQDTLNVKIKYSIEEAIEETIQRIKFNNAK